jgi:hypothetical protein
MAGWGRSEAEALRNALAAAGADGSGADGADGADGAGGAGGSGGPPTGDGGPFGDLEAALVARLTGGHPGGMTLGAQHFFTALAGLELQFVDTVSGLEVGVDGVPDAATSPVATGFDNVMATFKAPALLGESGAADDEAVQSLWSCAICLAMPEPGDDIGILSCTHRFHSACLRDALARDARCPTCRRSVYATEPTNEVEADASGGGGVVTRSMARGRRK